ncbi:hypothetical protein KIPB_009193, partial [Kipferlia bialata]|eukprot:g9193.t1
MELNIVGADGPMEPVRRPERVSRGGASSSAAGPTSRADMRREQARVAQLRGKDGPKVTRRTIFPVDMLRESEGVSQKAQKRQGRQSHETVFTAVKVNELNAHRYLQVGLTNLGVEKLTSIQHRSFETVLAEDNVVIHSQTGSGKTLAFLVPSVERLLRTQMFKEGKVNRASGTLLLIMAPTRELCLQIAQVADELTKRMPYLVVTALPGGEDRARQKARLRKGCAIVVGTPGRVRDHMRTTACWDISKCQSVVFDESDRLLDMGFAPQLGEIIASVHQRSERGMGMSHVLATATYQGKVARFFSSFADRAVVVTATKAEAKAAATKADGEPEVTGEDDEIMQQSK